MIDYKHYPGYYMFPRAFKNWHIEVQIISSGCQWLARCYVWEHCSVALAQKFFGTAKLLLSRRLRLRRFSSQVSKESLLLLLLLLCWLGAIQVELDDETKRLSDVRPFQPMLKLVEKTATGARAEKVIQAQISVLLGKRMIDIFVCYETSSTQTGM